jgi:hypothetical protein
VREVRLPARYLGEPVSEPVAPRAREAVAA